eukprot:5139975-Pleurochrysis_carterae.AAC.1
MVQSRIVRIVGHVAARQSAASQIQRHGPGQIRGEGRSKGCTVALETRTVRRKPEEEGRVAGAEKEPLRSDRCPVCRLVARVDDKAARGVVADAAVWKLPTQRRLNELAHLLKRTIAGNRRGNVKSNTDSRKAVSFGRKSSSPLCALHNAPSTVSRMKTCLARRLSRRTAAAVEEGPSRTPTVRSMNISSICYVPDML